MKSKIKKPTRKQLVDALRILVAFCTSGARYQTRNPYAIEAIKQALQVLADNEGHGDYLGVEYDYASLLPKDSLEYIGQ